MVAEWRDLDGLWQDHVDNAVVEAMLEGAEEGQPLDYPWYLLPAARVAKAWSAVRNALGGVGPVPEGMSASGALRNRTLSLRHAALKERTLELAARFEAQHGYRPPTWQLVRLARDRTHDTVTARPCYRDGMHAVAHVGDSRPGVASGRRRQ